MIGINAGSHRVADAGEGLRAEPRFMAQIVAALDEALSEILSCANTEQAIEGVEGLGLTKTAERLREARARGQLISIRTRAGLEVARSEGRKGGRRPKLTAEQIAEARGWLARKEKTLAAAARDLGVSRQTIYRALGENPETPAA